MNDAQAAAAFHRAGVGDDPLVPLYELFARSMSRLLPANGTVMDLGSASGRCLAYLSERRPDARLVGVELSESMLELGSDMLASEGLADRVRLVNGDMTACQNLAPEPLDLISCTLALHHLPSERELSVALEQIATIREASGCGVWIADIVRGDDGRAVERWMTQYADPEPLFWEDARASEAAGWTEGELTSALAKAGLGDLCRTGSTMLQVYWSRGRSREPTAAAWREITLSDDVRRRVMALRLNIRDLPT